MTATYRTVRRLAVLVVVALLAPLLVTVAGPASPATAAVGPQAIPADLWDINPAVGAGQTYVAFDGTPGDPITGGTDHLFTQADSVIQVSLDSGGLIAVSVKGDMKSGLVMKAMSGVDPMAVGYYPGATRYPFNLASAPGLDWGSGSTGCNQLAGWFAIDSITIVSGILTELTARFSQSCDGAPASFGKVRWIAGDTTTPPGPGVIPEDLWDTAPPVGADQSYVAVESPAGDLLGKGLPELYTKGTSVLRVTESGGKLSVTVAGDEAWTIEVVPMTSISSVQTGYYPGLLPVRQANPAKGGLEVYRNLSSCSSATGWVAVDQVTRVNGVVTALTMRFGTVCRPGDPELRGKVRWLASDPTPLAGVPTAIPGGLWDADPGVPSGQTYVVLAGDAGEPISGGGGGTFTRSNARVNVSENAGVINVQVDELSSWKGAFSTLGASVPLTSGYYSPASAMPTPNVTTGAMSWTRGTTTCAFASGWFAIDHISRSAGKLTSATIRFGLTCDGVHTLNGKVRWVASDVTGPAPIVPVPGGLWDVTPQGVSGNYTYIDGVVGDPVTNGADFVLQDPQHPGVPADYQGQIVAIIGSGDPQDFWLAEFDGLDDQGKVQLGYHSNLSSLTSPNPMLGGVRVTRYLAASSVKSCTPGTTTGWFAVDHLGRIDGQINKLDLRFEQSCDGNPPMHGRLHYDLGGLEVGPPIGAFETAVPVTGGMKVDGWALDPETASAIDVDVLVDGVVATTISASGNRPDVGSANPLYGNGHGLSATVTMSAGTHQVCMKARNTGVGTDTTLGCKTLKVGSGSPFGSFDVAYAGPNSVNVAGWAIDPDTSLPIAVHVYVDAVGAAFTADGSRPDVAGAFQGYGPAHGFSGKIATTPGTHNVCAYAINEGVGFTVSLGCKTVAVISGVPIGSFDVAGLVPGVGVKVGGWALDFDAVSPIPVHVYVDGKGVALTASASRPDVAAAYPGYGSAHGFSATIPAGPGQHTVCAYAIDVEGGGNTPLGCKVVNVPTGSPIGSLDLVAGGKGYVSAGGWAADPDTAAPIAVHLYVDAAGSAVTANLNRPDVGAYFPPWGPLHGWATTVNAAPGVHNVCAYAINVGAGSTTLLGCRLVAVT